MFYPNPTDDELFIDFKNSSFTGSLFITNTSGQVIYESLIEGNGVIEIPNLHIKGVYFVKLEPKNKGYSRTFRVVYL